MQIKFCKIKIGKVKSEKGFTLLELLFVTVVTGILSSTLILPFSSSLKQGTRPEIYNTATYLAVDALEWGRSDGFSTRRDAIVAAGTNPLTATNTLNIGNTVVRPYTETVVSEYVSHSASSFSFSATPTEIIRVTVTISNPEIISVTMSEILINDFYNRNADNL